MTFTKLSPQTVSSVMNKMPVCVHACMSAVDSGPLKLTSGDTCDVTTKSIIIMIESYCPRSELRGVLS